MKDSERTVTTKGRLHYIVSPAKVIPMQNLFVWAWQDATLIGSLANCKTKEEKSIFTLTRAILQACNETFGWSLPPGMW